jgi:hypothetical protein
MRMKLKNYQEDLVLNITDIVLQDRPDVEHSDKLLHDVAAFTLNRLPPRYIQSERGFTRLAAEHWINGQTGGGLSDLVEVLMLVNKAVDTIRSRRKEPESEPEQEPEEAFSPSLGPDPDELLVPWHNLPYLVGRVVDAKSHEPLPDVRVTLLVDGEVCPVAENGWTNPYTTSKATNGFFSFHPTPLRSDEERRDFVLTLRFEHTSHQPRETEVRVQTEAEYEAHDAFESERIRSLDTTYLEPR